MMYMVYLHFESFVLIVYLGECLRAFLGVWMVVIIIFIVLKC